MKKYELTESILQMIDRYIQIMMKKILIEDIDDEIFTLEWICMMKN